MSKQTTHPQVTKQQWLETVAPEDVCDFRYFDKANPSPPMIFTRAELNRLDRRKLLQIYRRCLNDEMSPIMWRGFTKPQILDMFFDGASKVELTPF